MTDTYAMPDASGLGPQLGEPTPPKQYKVTNAKEYEDVPVGAEYTDAEGNVRSKPVRSKADYEKIAEGSDYTDPEGNIRTKPKYEGVDFTAQTLYDMSVTDKERRKALERSYPGKVKETPEGLVVDDDGTLRKPGRGVSSVTGFMASSAAPTGGAVLGALGGGALGSAVPGAGNVAGAAAGGAGGALLGQTFNDVIMQLSGTYDRTRGEEAANMALAGMSGMAGAGVGRGIATVVPSIKAGVSAAGAAAPKLASSFLGAGEADVKMARELAEKGVAVPPSAWAKEAPHLQNVVEVFDPAFHTQQPLLESATAHYEKSAGQILKDMGIKEPGSLTKPTEAVPTQAAGETLLRKTLSESQAADEKMKSALETRKAALTAGQPEAIAQREALTKAAEDSRKAAQSLIDAGFKDIENDVQTAMKVAKADANSGDLWAQVGEKLRATKQGIQQRASVMYDQADELAGGHKPNVQGLSRAAEEFLDQLPEEFQQKYPDVVRKLRDLAGGKDPATGQYVKEPFEPTFGQLHNLRSLMRGNSDFYRLSPDIKNGAYKFFAQRVDNALRDVKSVPELKPAVEQLNRADAFYRENMPVFEAKQIDAVMKGLEAGEPADPKNLFNAVVKEGHTDLTKKVRDMVGPNLWAGVKAADVQEMLDASKTLVPGQIDGRAFAKQVLDRHRSNLLEVVHGKEATEKLLEQARNIEMLNGKLDIPVKPGDTVTQVIARAKQAAEEAKKAGAQDPIGTLAKETKKIDAEHSREAAKMKAEQRNDPLGFLYNPTTGATQAVDKILGSEDLILAAAAKFGEKSPEFDLLRQVYAQKILQGSLEPGKALEKISPEIQQIMFPNATLGQMQTLAREMDFLMGAGGLNKGTAQGMAAMSKVEHPWASIIGKGGTMSQILTAPTKAVPGADAAGRSLLGAYYGAMRKLMTSPAMLRWVEKGLNGSPEEREAVRALVSKVLQKGGAVGAGGAEAAYQGSGPQ